MAPHSMMDDDQIWVERFQRWKLHDCAPMLLDVLRPLGFVSSQLLIMAGPVLTTFVSAAQLDQFTALIEDPNRLARVRRALAAETDTS
jgi:hypothetical protein